MGTCSRIQNNLDKFISYSIYELSECFGVIGNVLPFHRVLGVPSSQWTSTEKKLPTNADTCSMYTTHSVHYVSTVV